MEDAVGYSVRCRGCTRAVLTGVLRIGDAEAEHLRAHLATCPSKFGRGEKDDGSGDIGVLLARFDVERTAG